MKKKNQSTKESLEQDMTDDLAKLDASIFTDAASICVARPPRSDWQLADGGFPHPSYVGEIESLYLQKKIERETEEQRKFRLDVRSYGGGRMYTPTPFTSKRFNIYQLRQQGTSWQVKFSQKFDSPLGRKIRYVLTFFNSLLATSFLLSSWDFPTPLSIIWVSSASGVLIGHAIFAFTRKATLKTNAIASLQAASTGEVLGKLATMSSQAYQKDSVDIGGRFLKAFDSWSDLMYGLYLLLENHKKEAELERHWRNVGNREVIARLKERAESRLQVLCDVEERADLLLAKLQKLESSFHLLIHEDNDLFKDDDVIIAAIENLSLEVLDSVNSLIAGITEIEST